MDRWAKYQLVRTNDENEVVIFESEFGGYTRIICELLNEKYGGDPTFEIREVFPD